MSCVTSARVSAIGLAVASWLATATSAIAHEGAFEIRSTEAGGGALAVTGGPHGAIVVALTFCSGGECLYEQAEVSIHTPEENLASPPLFALDAGTQVGVELVSFDQGVSIKVGSVKLDQPGDTANLGTAYTLHVEPIFQVTAPDGVLGEWHVELRFFDPVGAYASSGAIDLVLSNEPQTCGDGHLDDHEDCDHGDEPSSIGHACTDECTWLACGDPDGDGTPAASDALFVLGAAVGTQVCDHCLCDVDASGGVAPVTSVDALRVLNAGIGIGSATLECAPCQ